MCQNPVMRERRHEVTRLEGFSDAVFAFALTLLVVNLEVPKTTLELTKLARGFLPFAIMFAMVCWIWYEHNTFFRRYGLQDGWTVFLNSVLLFTVLFYVYPLKYLTLALYGQFFGVPDSPELGNGRLLMLLYSSGVVVIFTTIALLYVHAWWRRHDLNLTQLEQVALRYGGRAHVLTAFVGVLSILIVTVRPQWPHIAGLVYFLIGPLQTLNGFQAGKAQRKLEAGA